MLTSACGFLKWLTVVAQYNVVYGPSVLFGSRIMSCSQEGSFRNLIAKLPEEQFSVEKVNIEDNKHCPTKQLVDLA